MTDSTPTGRVSPPVRRYVAKILVALVAALGLAPGAAANDIAPFTTVFGTDVTHAGFGGMRNDGTGTLTVSGVTGTVTKAYLYWHGPTNSTDLTANAAVTFAGSPVVGLNIGLSSDNCWGFANSHAYRADVTALVSGNGSYSLAGFVKDGGNVNVNGASLIVFFNDGAAANNRDVVVFDGNDSNISNPYDADDWNVVLAGINYSSGSSSLTMHVSDGQGFNDDAITVNSSVLEPAGAIFQGQSVPFGTFDSFGHLWDIKSWDITSYLSPGPNTLTIHSGVQNDCLSLVVAVIDLPAGAAPPPRPATMTVTPETATNTVGDSHTVTADLDDTNGDPAPNNPILWVVTGPNPSQSTGVTDSNGKATLTYVGVNAGTDTITACVDANGNAACDAGEIQDSASKTWQPKQTDTTNPTCRVPSATGTDSSGKKYVEATAQDTGSGIASVQVTKAVNATVVVPPFAPGTKDPVVVRATKIDNSTSSSFEIRITDVAGNVTVCDPVIALHIRESGQPAGETYTGLPQAEHNVLVQNGDPGVNRVDVTVNGRTWKLTGLKAGEARTLDVSSAMKPGTDNTIAVTAHGRPQGSALVVISD